MSDHGCESTAGADDVRVGRRTVLEAACAGLVGAVGSQVAGASTGDVTEGPVVYDATGSGIAAVDADTGDVFWSHDAGFEAVTENVTVADGVVYGLEQVSFEHRVAFAADAVSGEIAWTYDGIDDWVGAGPTIVGDTFYAAASGGRLYAIDRHEGELLWDESVGENLGSDVTIAYGTVFLTDGLGAVAVSAEDGSVRWSADDLTNSGPMPAPTVVDRTVYYGTRAGVTALDVVDGSLEWSTEIDGGSSFTEVVFDGERLYVADLAEGMVAALDPEEGDVLWTAAEPVGVTYGSPTVGEGQVFVTVFDIDGRSVGVHAFDAADGSHSWSFERDSNVFWSAPTVYDGLVYVGDDDGAISAFRAGSGNRAWQAPVDEYSVSNTPMVVEDPHAGYGVGSRGRLGTEAHHEEARHYSESLPESVELDPFFATLPTTPSIEDDVTLDAGRSAPSAFVDEYTWRVGGSVLDEGGEAVEPDFDTPGLREVELTIAGPGGRTATVAEPVVVREAEPTVASYADVETGRVPRSGVAAARRDADAGIASEGAAAAAAFAWLTGRTVA